MNKAAIVDTDTVKGLIAIQPDIIYELKKRSLRKRLIVFISRLEQIPEVLPEDLQPLVNNYWPGPLTIVLNGTSYRMPKYQPLLHLIDEVGPLYSSSANLSDQPPVTNLAEIQTQFQGKINKLIIVEANSFHPAKISRIASTIFDYNQKKILRSGEISAEQISAYVPVKKDRPINLFLSFLRKKNAARNNHNK
ncbi:L-threonylcarbamoyladenylate synthase [Mycoplasmoides fastidiosum]|nr:Sua5/YciO/YrdC/YwlC family protein [Mycoplasmoides fastidiosum]UUD37633.1 Sua5/YciO/YrdC/YwlC family protein [Mycoplasmoides fastidiosum]